MVYSIPTPPVLVFEDLTQDNFGMHYDPLPLKDLQFILERIAKYHALSMVIAESDKSELVSGFSSGFEAEKLRPMFQSTIKEYTKLGEIVEQWPGMEEIGAKIQKSPEKIFENFAKSYTKRNTWGFNVLNHGDFHIRNMMFKKNGQGSIEDVTFLDYQVPMYHSPAFDLVYMFNLIGGREVRDRKFEVVNLYHKELRKNLTKYGFTGEIPSVIDIHVELFNLVGFGEKIECYYLNTYLIKLFYYLHRDLPHNRIDACFQSGPHGSRAGRTVQQDRREPDHDRVEEAV